MNDPPTHADENFQEICHVADEAVRLIQQRWRSALAQRRPAARQPGGTMAARRVLASSEGGSVTAAVARERSRRLVRDDEQPENSEAVVAAAKHLCLAEAKARAARQIQRRWRQYREAVEELRSLRSTVSTHGSVEELNALCDYLQDDSVWSQDDDDDDDDDDPETAAEPGETVSHHHRSSPPLTHGADAVHRSALPAASPSPPPLDGEDRVSVSSLLSSIFAVVPSVALHHHHHIDAEEHPPPAGASSSSSVSHDRTDFDAVDSLRQLAAQIIQGWYRRNVRRRNRLQAVPESAVNALRVLQNRFRMVRLRRIMRERDAHQLVSRLQSLWRRRRELKQHFAALRRGREDAAARDIQRAYLRHRQRQNGFAVSTPPEQRLGGVPALATSSMARGEGGETSMPLCIVCLGEEVQIAMLPCGHAQVCAGCGSRCDRCPTCRKLIALQIRIYL